MTTTKSIKVTVKYRASAYVTSTISYKSASSTMSPRVAVERLAEKLLGEQVGDIRELPKTDDQETGTSYWHILPAAEESGS